MKNDQLSGLFHLVTLCHQSIHTQSTPDVGAHLVLQADFLCPLSLLPFICSFVFSHLPKPSSYTFQVCSQKTPNYHNGIFFPPLAFWVDLEEFCSLAHEKNGSGDFLLSKDKSCVQKRCFTPGKVAAQLQEFQEPAIYNKAVSQTKHFLLTMNRNSIHIKEKKKKPTTQPYIEHQKRKQFLSRLCLPKTC